MGIFFTSKVNTKICHIFVVYSGVLFVFIYFQINILDLSRLMLNYILATPHWGVNGILLYLSFVCIHHYTSKTPCVILVYFFISSTGTWWFRLIL